MQKKLKIYDGISISCPVFIILDSEDAVEKYFDYRRSLQSDEKSLSEKDQFIRDVYRSDKHYKVYQIPLHALFACFGPFESGKVAPFRRGQFYLTESEAVKEAQRADGLFS